jgi:molecular chaperone DnaK (HSP70)
MKRTQMIKQDAEFAPVFLGIDLGTTYSSVAYVHFTVGEHREKPAFEPINIRLVSGEIQDDTDRVFLLPTIVDYGVSVPEIGKRTSQDSGFVVKEFKPDLGLEKEYRLLDGQVKTPEDAATEVLRYLKRCAEGTLRKVSGLYLVMPPFIPEKHGLDKTDVLIRIGKSAGFEPVNVIEEPIAALIDLDFSTGGILTQEDKVIMIVDYGGGTCDVAIARASYKRLMRKKPKLLGLGSEQCGGGKIDAAIAEWLRGHRSEHAQLFSDWDLKKIAERLKEEMSDYIDDRRETPPSKVGGYDWKFSRQIFENLSRPVVKEMTSAFQQALDEAKDSEKTDVRVDEVFLVGGGSLHPLVRQVTKKFFSKSERSPKIHPVGKQPQLSVSRGAALYWFYRASGKIPMLDTLRQDLYLQFSDGSTKRLARRGQNIPLKHPNRFEVDVIETTDEITLNLCRKDPRSGAIYSYADATLEFEKRIPAGTRLRLDVTVDLRQHVDIKAYPRKRKDISAETVVRRPVS